MKPETQKRLEMYNYAVSQLNKFSVEGAKIIFKKAPEALKLTSERDLDNLETNWFGEKLTSGTLHQRQVTWDFFQNINHGVVPKDIRQ